MALLNSGVIVILEWYTNACNNNPEYLHIKYCGIDKLAGVGWAPSVLCLTFTYLAQVDTTKVQEDIYNVLIIREFD